jgi:acetyl coenzyme A synthetase (ADP forming)-like protein
MSNSTLDAIFRPRSVAVIGASRRRPSIGAEVFHNLLASGFTGPVYPVNAKTTVVQSVHAYPSILQIPGPVDLAVLAVPRDQVLPTVDECAAKGVRGMVILTAGFAETGAAGRALQDQLRQRVRAHGIRLVGPNCLGVLNTEQGFQLNATFAPNWPPAGNVAIASQSGAIGLALLDYARDLGIGIRHFASMGNKADISGNDLLEYWEDDPGTRVILLYLESLGNPARFMEIARRVSRKKPILVVKSGRTAAGARAASSHTGALAGMDVAVDALLGQAGVVRADTIEELFGLTRLLANQPVPRGPRVAIVTNAGGPGIMASDAAESQGLAMARLSETTTSALRSFLPAEAAVANPVDMIASAPSASYEKAIHLVLGDDGVDSLLVLFVPPVVTEASDVADAIRRAAATATKPVLACILGTQGVDLALSTLHQGKFPAYAFPEDAIAALARAVRYGQLRQRPEAAPWQPAGISPERARQVIAAGGAGGEAGRWLEPAEVSELLSAYGLRLPRAITATSVDDAMAKATQLGFPLALKLVSKTITHKTEVGGVQLGLKNIDEVAGAYRRIEARLAELGQRASFDGVLLQQMVTGGVEAYLGMTQAPGFGALLGFGMGGIAVEVWKDVAFRVHPLTPTDAEEMIDQIRGKVLLQGFRGAPAADRAALIGAILRVSRLVGDVPEIQEMDINPLMAMPKGQGVIAVDARIRVGPAAQSPQSLTGVT